MIQVLIDQVTIVVIMTEIQTIEEWTERIDRLILHIEESLSLRAILGMRHDAKASAGYSCGYEYGLHPFYFRIGYHPMHPKQGILIKFSAHALEYYRAHYKELYGTPIDVNGILQMLNSSIYSESLFEIIKNDKVSYRCSRIDIAVDYIDEDVSITELYNGLAAGEYSTQYANGRNNRSGLHGRTNKDKVETFYIGKPRQRNQRALLRVYDKKTEELLNSNAFRRDTALQCRNWVRFEVEYHAPYTHDLTEIIRCTDNNQLCNVLLSSILERYRFWNNVQESYHNVTSDMLSLLEKELPIFSSRIESDASLQKKVEHMMKGSGLIPLLYHIREIWGEDGVNDFKELMDNFLARHIPSKKDRDWLRHHKDDLVGTEIPFRMKNMT